MDPREISPRIFPEREIIQAIPPRAVRTLATSYGALFGGIDLLTRQITVRMNIAGKNHDDANDLVSALNGLFCTDEPAELEPTHMPGRAFTAILESAGDLEWRWGFGTVEYVFSAPRPFIHSTDWQIIRFTGSAIIKPAGTVPVLPVITHTMAAQADNLTVSLNGAQAFRLRPVTGNFEAGETLKIDFLNRLVTRAGEAAMHLVDYTASTWHPDIKTACTLLTSDTGLTEARWRDEWM